MKKIIKILTVLLMLLLLGSSIIAFTGCEDKEKKYDLSLIISRRTRWTERLAGPLVEEYICTPDTEDYYVQWEYDGKSYAIGIEAYCLSNHPKYKNRMIDLHEGGLYYEISMTTVEDVDTQILPRMIQEKGNYLLTVKINGLEDTLYKSRTVRLHISIV